MKILQNLLGILFTFCLMITLLITSVEAVAYWTPGYYEKEYSKYNVGDAVDMEMDDLLELTQEMMSYLRGNRPDLHVQTTIGGIEREFFSEREIAHMEDVRGLFLAALSLRRICLALMLFSIIGLLLSKAGIKRTLPRMLCIGTGLFSAILIGLAAIISTDFNKYFVIFHHIFFDNDLWILDPRTDMLINIVPEPFFMDTALRIGLTFGICVLVIFVLSLSMWLKHPYSGRES